MNKTIKTPQLRFPEFEGEWGTKKLGQVSKYYDGTHQTPNYVESGIPFYSVEHVTANQFAKTKYISEDVWEKENKRVKLEKGDILMTRIGDIGTARYIDWNVKASFYVSLALLKVHKEYDSQYISKYIETLSFQRELHKRTIHVAFPKKINLGEIGNCYFKLPTLPEQQKIAAFLTEQDDYIASLEKEEQLLQAYKKGIMQRIFAPKGDPEGKPKRLRFKDDNGNAFPEWEENKLGELTTKMQSGVSRKLSDSDIGLPILRSNNLLDGQLDVSDIKYWYLIDDQGADLTNYYLDEGDILVNFINSIAQIGKVSMFTNRLNRDTIFTTNLLRIKLKKEVSEKFIFYSFHLKRYRHYIQSITKPAVNQASFTTKDFNNYIIQLPCLEEQQKIADFLSKIDEQIDGIKTQIAQAKSLKKGLLQKMFV